MNKRKLIIIGSGPAGLTAGIYAGRADLKPLVFTGQDIGGQLINTSVVENWPGNINGIQGPELMMNMKKQAEKFGCEIFNKNINKVDFSNNIKSVWVGQEQYSAEAIIIATGAKARMLGVPGEEEFLGKGVAVCAVCDAPFYKDLVTFVIGGGDAACEDALALTKYAKKVYLVHRRDELRASKIMADRVKNHNKIEILWNTELKAIKGRDKVEEVVLRKTKFRTHKIKVRNLLKADGVFFAIGHIPATDIFKEQVDLDKKGYVKVKNNTETNIYGVFAAGDVVDYKYQQAITAAGMGCQAALDAEKYLEK